MAVIFDFPINPSTGQMWTAPTGAVYVFDGYAWGEGYYDSSSQLLTGIGDLVDQVRTLLQDTDPSSGGYRYSTDSIVTNFNQGMMDLYRIRPDLFLENLFIIPQYNVGQLNAAVFLEPQYIPPLIYYVVGLTQARDDEQNQDARAFGFLKIFQQTVVNGGFS